MKKWETHGLVFTLCVYLLLCILPEFIAPPGQPVASSFQSFDLNQGFKTTAKKTGPPIVSKQKPAKKDFHLRTFSWSGADKKLKRVTFSLAKPQIRSELNKFGITRGMEHTLLLQKKGFTRVGISMGVEIYMVNYREIFLRNLEYFKGLTQALYDAIKPQPPERQLMEFLFFVQAIKYKKPPFYYNNKFINSFFPPLICLYEQTGDCDSKSVLLAVFLTCHNKKEKTALLFINHLGLKHSILLVKRLPSPGMSGIFIKGKGYYIPLEASSPGWAPGFVNQRLWNAITTGNFRISELQ